MYTFQINIPDSASPEAQDLLIQLQADLQRVALDQGDELLPKHDGVSSNLLSGLKLVVGAVSALKKLVKPILDFLQGKPEVQEISIEYKSKGKTKKIKLKGNMSVEKAEAMIDKAEANLSIEDGK